VFHIYKDDDSNLSKYYVLDFGVVHLNVKKKLFGSCVLFFYFGRYVFALNHNIYDSHLAIALQQLF